MKIVDLARDMIQLSGLEVGKDIQIEFTGLRPGEKLFEELFLPDEQRERTRHERVFVARNGQGRKLRSNAVTKLIAAAEAADVESMRQWLAELLPEISRASVAPPVDPLAAPAGSRTVHTSRVSAASIGRHEGIPQRRAPR